MDKKFIFDFAGSHCTGKTTLMGSVKKEILDLGYSCEIVESVTRDFFVNQGFKIYDKTDSCVQSMFSYFNSGVVLDCEAQVVLSTAFGVRPLAYAMCSEYVSVDVEVMHWKYLRFFASKEFQNCRTVTWFYLPATFPMEEDGIRGRGWGTGSRRTVQVESR
ncbi:hypothetical protein LCGC14_2425930 [marine sediment metagenome]|uniref:NadR/Ttd14 AAA domain-containing protein n=1 Tax=marine sediment metagenome TaxID=412755 RepID=A0A0F9EHG3_9ZZZZ